MKEYCENCQGTGWVDCPECEGHGWITVRDWTGDPQTERDVPCLECNTRGRVSCPNCAGARFFEEAS